MSKVVLLYNNGETHKMNTGDKQAFLSRKGIFDIDLEPLGNCQLLEEIYLRENRLWSLDLSPLSNCPRLKEIHLDLNELGSLDLTPLRHCSMLEKVILTRNPLSDLDVSPLFSSRAFQDLSVPDHTKLYAKSSLKSRMNRGIRRVAGRINWYDGESLVHEELSEMPAKHPTTQKSVEGSVDERTMKKALGVLKSFPRISMSDLAGYSGLSPDRARELVFEFVGEGRIEGRFDPEKDEFICVDAVVADKRMKSNGSALARCAYCGKPLPKALNAGEELTCPSCGMINIG